MKKVLFLVFFCGLLFFPLSSLADGTYRATIKGTTYTVSYDGLVPCGKDVEIDGHTFSEIFSGDKEICPIASHCEMPCQFCHFFVMLQGIIEFLLVPPDGIVFIIAVIMLVIGGAMIIFSGASPSLFKKGKDTITWAIVGLVVIFGAWLFVNTFFLMIGVADWTELREGWFVIDCPIELP